MDKFKPDFFIKTQSSEARMIWLFLDYLHIINMNDVLECSCQFLIDALNLTNSAILYGLEDLYNTGIVKYNFEDTDNSTFHIELMLPYNEIGKKINFSDMQTSDKVKPNNYHIYLLSEQWAIVKRIALAFFNNQCQLCGSKEKLNVHHKNYSKVGNETLEDVILLCNECHKTFHNK